MSSLLASFVGEEQNTEGHLGNFRFLFLLRGGRRLNCQWQHSLYLLSALNINYYKNTHSSLVSWYQPSETLVSLLQLGINSGVNEGEQPQWPHQPVIHFSEMEKSWAAADLNIVMMGLTNGWKFLVIYWGSRWWKRLQQKRQKFY